MKGDYDNKPASGAEKNKPNQSQSRLAPRPALGVENKANMAAFGTKSETKGIGAK